MEFVDALPEDGERRLMLAVLIDAVRAVGARAIGSPADLRLHREILKERAWFQSTERSGLFSFANVCDALGLNADYIRRCVLKRPAGERPMKVRRYAAKAEESWIRQRRDRGRILPRGYAAADMDETVAQRSALAS